MKFFKKLPLSVVRMFIFCLALLSASICFSQEQADYPQYLLYIPEGIEKPNTYPLVVALSPSADAQSMIDVWKPVADKMKWIIFASKESKNGQDMNLILGSLAKSIKEVSAEFPIDKSKIVITGFSGGAMCSHALAYSYPSLVSAIVLNTGMINEYYLGQKANYSRNKMAAFIASPSDFRYSEMRRDKEFLDSLGWKTKWIEFGGGHTLAPSAVYLEAAKWVNEQWDKKAQASAVSVQEAVPVKAQSVDAPKFNVNGIIFNSKEKAKSIVIINGEMLHEGERFYGLQVVKINEDSVIVTADGKKKTLKVQQNF